MEMMAQYHSVILSPGQLGSVGMIWLIAMAAVFSFHLNRWLRPPALRRRDNDLLQKLCFHLPPGVPERHKPAPKASRGGEERLEN